MARKSLTSTNVDTMPGYMAAAVGVSREWISQALCIDEDGQSIRLWHVNRNDWVKVGPGPKVKGEKFVEMALLVCHGCPVQWHCARFAVLTNAQACTWAAPLEDIQWLGRQPDWEVVLDVAEEDQLPVQVAIRRLRGARVGS
jgi:hypothetical protein